MNISEEPRGGPEYPCSDHGTCSKAQELVGDLHIWLIPENKPTRGGHKI